jgi:phage repressor protein C with HTH and peptisase S24 domain
MRAMELKDRVVAAREYAKLTQDQLATRIGMAQQTLSRLETGKNKGTSRLTDIAIECGVSPRWLAREEGEMLEVGRVPAYEVREVSADYLDPARDVLIDVVDVRLSAGPGAMVPEFIKTKYKRAFDQEWLRKKRLRAEDLRVMPVHGDSMLFTLADGDTVLVDTSDTDRIVDGKIYALATPGGSKIKRLRWQAGGNLIVSSDNPDKHMYPDEVIEPHRLGETVFIIGRAVQRAGDL